MKKRTRTIRQGHVSLYAPQRPRAAEVALLYPFQQMLDTFAQVAKQLHDEVLEIVGSGSFRYLAVLAADLKRRGIID